MVRLNMGAQARRERRAYASSGRGSDFAKLSLVAVQVVPIS